MSFGKAVILGSFLASSQQASEWPDYSSRLGAETRGTWTIVRGCRFEGSAILLADVCGLGGWTIADNRGEECGRGHRATPPLAARLFGDAGAGRRGCGYSTPLDHMLVCHWCGIESDCQYVLFEISDLLNNPWRLTRANI
jgi:hypothetical protein